MAGLIAFGGAALLAVVHAVAGRLRFLDVVPRSRWLSFASGMSVAYVFLHLLPELHEAYEPLGRMMRPTVGFVEHHVYIVAMLGLAVFYGLERLAVEDRERRPGDDTSPIVFRAHISSFAAYNALIGYVLAERAREPVPFGLFLLAMLLHFFVNDFGLRQHHKEDYDRSGRWVLVAAVLLGTAAGALWTVPEHFLQLPLAFIGGGVILNVLKEELPEERQSRFWSFALGLAAYSVLLLSL